MPMSGGSQDKSGRTFPGISQLVETERRNAEKPLGDDQQFVTQDPQFHLLPKSCNVAAKQVTAITSTTKFFSRWYFITRISSKL